MHQTCSCLWRTKRCIVAHRCLRHRPSVIQQYIRSHVHKASYDQRTYKHTQNHRRTSLPSTCCARMCSMIYVQHKNSKCNWIQATRMNLHPICEASQQHTPIVINNICILTQPHPPRLRRAWWSHATMTFSSTNKKTELRLNYDKNRCNKESVSLTNKEDDAKVTKNITTTVYRRRESAATGARKAPGWTPCEP